MSHLARQAISRGPSQTEEDSEVPAGITCLATRILYL
jgi:hypothetical protein